MTKLRVLDLFSGIGGFSLGLERTGGFETVAFCEIEPFPRKVLAKHWPKVPIFEDVRTLDANGLGRIDCITGGYPCQPFSYAGNRNGAEDNRHLWPEMFRLVKALRPTWVLGENVAGHITMGLDDVLADLDSLGYSAQAFVIPACAVNAPHRRERIWLVANAPDMQRDGSDHNSGKFMGRKPIPQSGNRSGAQTVANTVSLRGRSRDGKRQHAIHANPCGEAVRTGTDGSWWAVEPSVGRVANGVPNRVDRLKALGNAVVPQIPELIGNAILQWGGDIRKEQAA